MTMERTEVLDLMSQLKLFGMKNAYDEILATALKRQHEPQRFAGDLLKAEIFEKQARSIKYQLTIAKLPLAKDVDGFEFKGTPINESLVRDLAGGGFIAQQRNVVLVGGTGTGKTHLAMAIARSCIRAGSRPVLQHCRSGQSARGRRTDGPPGAPRRLSHAPRLRHPR
jgi:DNA replication protein DnaC